GVCAGGRDGEIARTGVGGHTTRRIIPAGGDATGAVVLRALNAAGPRGPPEAVGPWPAVPGRAGGAR
ncbi:hypothetical protein, partial [Nocardia wallacei]|uniref:hypothetical protein n=1 Tax=Nocardia wallacei TaxID=480035 RepID=UPI002456DEF3